MPGAICTSSHPSDPKLSKICLAACVRIGAVRYSHFVMPGTLLGAGRTRSVDEGAELVALGVGVHGPGRVTRRVPDTPGTVGLESAEVGGVEVPVDAVLDRLRLRHGHEHQGLE